MKNTCSWRRFIRFFFFHGLSTKCGICFPPLGFVPRVTVPGSDWKGMICTMVIGREVGWSRLQRKLRSYTLTLSFHYKNKLYKNVEAGKLLNF